MRRFIQLSSILIILTFLGGCTSNALYNDVSDISEKNIGVLHSNVESQLISRSPAPNGYEFGGVNLQFGGVNKFV